LSIVRDLTLTTGQRDATVVLTIDQAEELFVSSDKDATARFLGVIRATLRTADRQLVLLATMRADALQNFQQHPELQERGAADASLYRVVPVDPMPKENIPQVIRGPANLAGLKLADDLVDAMVQDTDSRDALPLLAFTLRQLYERYKQDGILSLRQYVDFGRIAGAVRAEADRLVESSHPSSEDLERLRAMFVPALVQINADGGYFRRRALRDEMPANASALLDAFIEARLMVQNTDQHGRVTVEVAHEALLRTWPRLTRWLAEDQDRLRLLESLRRASDAWTQSGRSQELLLHRDGRLHDAEALVSSPRFAATAGSLYTDYLSACRAAQAVREAGEREEQERRLRDAERIAEAKRKVAQRTTIGIAVVSALCVVVSGLALSFWKEKKEIQAEARRSAELNELASKALDSIMSDQAVGGVLLVDSPDPGDAGRGAWRSLMQAKPFAMYLEHGKGRIIAVAHDALLIPKTGDGAGFLFGALNWLSNDVRSKRLLVSGGHCEVVGYGTKNDYAFPEAKVQKWGYRQVGVLTDFTQLARQSADSVLIVGNAWGANLSDAEILSVEQYVANGGGLLAAGLGWSWELYHADAGFNPCNWEPRSAGKIRADGSLSQDYPMNRLMRPFGLAWARDTTKAP
jgi:hypothetical protein